MAALHAASFTAPRPWTEAEFRNLLADPGVFAETAPDGFALGRAAGGEAELLTLAVAPEARRRGTGRALLAGIERSARARGATACFLEVAADNGAALGLYRAAGYADAGRRPAYFRRPDGTRCDAIVLRRVL